MERLIPPVSGLPSTVSSCTAPGWAEAEPPGGRACRREAAQDWPLGRRGCCSSRRKLHPKARRDPAPPATRPCPHKGPGALMRSRLFSPSPVTLDSGTASHVRLGGSSLGSSNAFHRGCAEAVTDSHPCSAVSALTGPFCRRARGTHLSFPVHQSCPPTGLTPHPVIWLGWACGFSQCGCAFPLATNQGSASRAGPLGGGSELPAAMEQVLVISLRQA